MAESQNPMANGDVANCDHAADARVDPFRLEASGILSLLDSSTSLRIGMGLKCRLSPDLLPERIAA